MASRNQFVKAFGDAYSLMGETHQSDFARIFSKLMKQNFILKECEDDRKDYFFLMENKELFQNFFAIVDYELIYDANNHCFYLKTIENRNRVRLTKFDTAVLLILRKMYYMKRREITSDDKVLITLDELVDQVRTTQIFIPEKKISAYSETLRKFRIHKIVDYSGSKIFTDMNIQILSSILIVVPQENIDEVLSRLEALRVDNGGDNDEDSDEDQID